MKPNDYPYGFSRIKDNVKNSSPILNQDNFSKYMYYMSERNSIYQEKEILGYPYPWTDDPILRDNSFTCIKRWQDRTSRWLIEHISTNPELVDYEKVWRTFVFRLYNKIETAELIGLDKPDFWNNIDKAMDAIDNYPNDPYTRAYKVISLKYAYRDESPKGHDYWKSSLLWHISEKRNEIGNKMSNNLFLYEIGGRHPSDTIKFIKSLANGIGNFLAYQIFVDLTYIESYPISEEEFVISGPGCKAGLDMLFEDRDGLRDDELLFWLRDNIEDIFKEHEFYIDSFFWYLPEDKRKLTVMDLENSMCEFSKYIYLTEGRHKRPRKYKPKEIK